MSEVLEKYNLLFSIENGVTTASSVSPLLSYYLSNSALSQAVELYNGLQYFVQYRQSEERDIILTRNFNVRGKGEDVKIVYNDPVNSPGFPEPVFTLPVNDLLLILKSWSEFLSPFKVREVQVKNGQAVIDIVSDDFATALFIEKAVAVIWPDCRGSIGEYYAVSKEEPDRQKALTAKLVQSLTSGSDLEVFNAISGFLDLFANGNYQVIIGGIDVASAEIVRDFNNPDGDEAYDGFTCQSYHYSYGELILFSRAINTVDQNRVKEFIEIISAGGRPKVVVFTNSAIAHSYVLDGHHKLLAYEELGITAPAVIIEKRDVTGKNHKNMIPELLDFLKPAEIKHVIAENDNISALDVYTSAKVTAYLDAILHEHKSISTTLHRLLRNTYISGDEDLKSWTEGRLFVLQNNKYQGKGQVLYYTKNNVEYYQLFIENEDDFNLWRNMFLENAEIPVDLAERQKEITKRHYPPPQPLKVNPILSEVSKQEPVRNSGHQYFTWQLIARVILIYIALLAIIKGCK